MDVILRAVLVYLFLLVLFRLAGRTTLAQITSSYPEAISSISRSVASASPRALWSPPGSFWLW